MSYFIKTNREQLRFMEIDIEKLIPQNHPVRFYWKICEEMDLTSLYNDYKITEESEGRPAYDPKLLLCLWVYGYSQGIKSTRKLEEATKYRADFMWLCGGITPDYRTLAYFRVNHTKGIEEAFCKFVFTLKEAGLIKMEKFFQDGSKIRADASPDSFKRKDKLLKEWEELKEAYKEFVNGEDGEEDSKIINKGIEKRLKKIEKAIKRAEEIEERRKRLKGEAREKYPPEEAKASPTDPDSQFMRFKEGFKAPGYNAQICIEEEFIVGKKVCNEPTDTNQLIPMIKEIKDNLDLKEINLYVTDNGYYNDVNIEEVKKIGVKRLVMAIHNDSKKEETRKVKEMSESEEGRELLKELKERIEKVFGHIKEKGFNFRRFNLRGLVKVSCEWTLICIAYNIFKYFQIVMNATG